MTDAAPLKPARKRSADAATPKDPSGLPSRTGPARDEGRALAGAGKAATGDARRGRAADRRRRRRPRGARRSSWRIGPSIWPRTRRRPTSCCSSCTA